MAVLSSREVLPRTFSHKFGSSPTAERRFELTLDGPTATQVILDAVAIYHGAAHPEYAYLLCTEGSVTEPDRFHAEVTYRYETPAVSVAGFIPGPLARPDVWSFSTGGAAVPALFYFHGSGNNDRRALVNTAGDFFESAMTEESELRCSIAGNRATFPASTAALVTNCVNSDSFMGASPHQWKCAGISGQQQVEVVNGLEVSYWSITAELVYRQSGWNLPLPNVGYNFLSNNGTERKRCYVIDDATLEKVPSANPIALTPTGEMRLNTNLTGSGAIDILSRRVHREVAFAGYFGSPPAGVS